MSPVHALYDEYVLRMRTSERANVQLWTIQTGTESIVSHLIFYQDVLTASYKISVRRKAGESGSYTETNFTRGNERRLEKEDPFLFEYFTTVPGMYEYGLYGVCVIVWPLTDICVRIRTCILALRWMRYGDESKHVPRVVFLTYRGGNYLTNRRHLTFIFTNFDTERGDVPRRVKYDA